MAVLNTIQHYNQWAIVHDHTGYGNYFEPQQPNWHCVIDGRQVQSFATRQKSVDYVRRCQVAGSAF